jgi:spermidine synthase
MSRRWLFGFFLVSGFCSLVLEVVWLRLAMARFGVTTALTSIVLSVFMGGLALGSWGAGRLSRAVGTRPPALALRLYASAEIAIALGATSVPRLLDWGRLVLLRASPGTGWGSATYHAAAGLLVAVALLPFCACMGATFPLAISVLRRSPGERARSFSYLYVANVVGATLGALVSAFVAIELLGFAGTLSAVAVLNALLGATALALSLGAPLSEGREGAPEVEGPAFAGRTETAPLVVLFLTGLASMGMELVWVRQLTPYLGNVVYTFAVILGVYLTATFMGSALYRRWSGRSAGGALTTLSPGLWALVAVAAMLPLAATDPRVPLPGTFAGGVVRAVVGTLPFCGALGFTTPFLTDRRSGGDPRLVGSAYALNVLGCIVGPLLAGFSLLPAFGEGGTLATLSIPLLAAGAAGAAAARGPGPRRAGAQWILAATGLVVVALFTTRSFESLFAGAVVRRDSTATVAAFGKGMSRQLLVNGIGMTELSPITKMMAHLPLAFRDAPAERALIICFGMGTSYRSSLSWGVRTTAVELVPSVPALFGFFHADASALASSPLGRIVVDDGRRFLERSPDVYDVVVVDPPPPVWAAGSSLLYSREFCEMLRRRLGSRGIVQQWIPGGEPLVVASIVKALMCTFPHVRAFQSVEGWGLHLLASSHPIASASAGALAARLPRRAVEDLLEWGPYHTAADQFAAVLSRELRLADIVPAGVPALTDDRPLNEYFLLRQALAGRAATGPVQGR